MIRPWGSSIVMDHESINFAALVKRPASVSVLSSEEIRHRQDCGSPANCDANSLLFSVQVFFYRYGIFPDLEDRQNSTEVRVYDLIAIRSMVPDCYSMSLRSDVHQLYISRHCGQSWMLCPWTHPVLRSASWTEGRGVYFSSLESLVS